MTMDIRPTKTYSTSKDLEVAERIRAAFPKVLSVEVDSVFNNIPLSSIPPTPNDIGYIAINGESLHIPSRIYWQQPDQAVIDKLTEIQFLILACLYTRSSDGFIRDRYIELIVRHPEEWAIPYIIQLLGEYVIEIIYVIEQNLKCLNKEPFSKFKKENPEFIRLTREHITSYWNVYRRREINKLKDDPGYKVMHHLDLW
ncbi:MAG: hypothetical protein ACOWWR_13310 [Eubacteriales bacterium]